MSVRSILFFLMISTYTLSTQAGIFTCIANIALKYYMKTSGTEDASEQYSSQIRQFLKYLGVKNPEQVTIKKMSTDYISKETSIALTKSHIGIWLNEYELQYHSKGVQLFILAHEAAHYVETFWSMPHGIKEIEKQADLMAAKILCALGYGWALQAYADHVKQKMDRGEEYDNLHPSIQEQYNYLKNILKTA